MCVFALFRFLYVRGFFKKLSVGDFFPVVWAHSLPEVLRHPQFLNPRRLSLRSLFFSFLGDFCVQNLYRYVVKFLGVGRSCLIDALLRAFQFPSPFSDYDT